MQWDNQHPLGPEEREKLRLDTARDRLEFGQLGPDHDVPYVFRLPFGYRTIEALTALAARWHRGEFTEDGWEPKSEETAA
jgi:hypothetical protein